MTMKEVAKKIIASINPGIADISNIGDGTIKGAISELNKKTFKGILLKTIVGESKWGDPIDITGYSSLLLIVKNSSGKYVNSLFFPVFNASFSGANALPVRGADNNQVGMMQINRKQIILHIFSGNSVEIYV